MKLTMDKLRELCIEYLNHREPEINSCGSKMSAGDFIFAHDRNTFDKKLTEYISKLWAAGIISKSPSTDPNKMYSFTADSSKHLSLFKYIE